MRGQGAIATDQTVSDEAWLTVSEAARLIDASPDLVSRWATLGDLKANGKAGREQRITLASARVQVQRWHGRTNENGSGWGPTRKLGEADHGTHAVEKQASDSNFPFIGAVLLTDRNRGRGPQLLIDRDTFTVTYDGGSCELRNTKEFQFFELLSRRPGVYVSVDRLIDDVWDGEIRSDSAIKTVASNLRKGLKEAGIEGLHIDGTTNRRHYAMILS